ncbi:hypothetical protein [Spirosoma terrae]|uniref:Uncharacterized protein n=1 Tax=Spirosoma terrae TaxID=1968276 RepID=A0A6L9LEQ5_9BACT|nr:hypothetical protein [Spirosoma terrae]NDU99095.1 hypothetical protein [Spirosoma terrae]
MLSNVISTEIYPCGAQQEQPNFRPALRSSGAIRMSPETCHQRIKPVLSRGAQPVDRDPNATLFLGYAPNAHNG